MILKVLVYIKGASTSSTKKCALSSVSLVSSDGPRGGKLQHLLLRETATSPFISLLFDSSFMRYWPFDAHQSHSHCRVGPTFHCLIASHALLSGACYTAGRFATTLIYPTFFCFVAFVRSTVSIARGGCHHCFCFSFGLLRWGGWLGLRHLLRYDSAFFFLAPLPICHFFTLRSDLLRLGTVLAIPHPLLSPSLRI
jgi:hypothetical protein